MLGGSVVLAVVGLGLRAAALAVAVAALAAPALIACLSEAVLPRGATVGFESHGFFCSGAACSFCLSPSLYRLVTNTCIKNLLDSCGMLRVHA